MDDAMNSVAEQLGHEGQRRALDTLVATLQRRGFYGGLILKFQAGHLTYTRVEETVPVEELTSWANGQPARRREAQCTTTMEKGGLP
jgi:hypothetical protein